MLLGKIDLTENTDLEFGLEVQGTIEKASEVRFVIEGPDFDVSCKCEESAGTIIAHIPKLKGVLAAGVYESKLEVVLDGKIFTPLRESIEINPLVEFDVSKKSIKPVKEGVKVVVKNAVSEDVKITKRDKAIQKAIAEGYEVQTVNNFEVLKKDGLYYGIIGEKVVFSDKGHQTLSDLVNELSK